MTISDMQCNSTGIKAKTLTGTIFLVALFAIILIGSAYKAILNINESNYRLVKQKCIEARKQELKSEVDVALGILNSVYQEAKQSGIDSETAKKRAVAQLRPIRFFANKSGYYMIHALSGNRATGVMIPVMTEIEGVDITNFEDSTGKRFVKDFVKAARSGGGFIEYDFPKEPGGKPFPKLTYIGHFAPWDWEVGVGVYTDDIEAEALKIKATGMAAANREFNSMLFVAGVALLIISLVLWAMLGTTVNRIAEQLSDTIDGLRSAQAKLKESADFRKRVFESSLMPIVVMDSEKFAILDCNPAAVQIYQSNSIEETLGKTPLDVSAPIQYDGTPSEIKAKYFIEKALQEGVVNFEWRHQRADGSQWDADVHLMSFKSDDRQLLQFTLHDITQRKAAERALQESEVRYRQLFENNPVPMLIYERGTLRLLAVNEAFVHAYGYSREEALTLLLPDLYPENEKSPIIAKAKEIVGHAYAGEWHHVRKDGSLMTVVATSHDFTYQEHAARIAVVTDITERKLIEDELTLHRQHLEELVQSRTAELETARDQAQAADRAKSEFLANMSHEIRTPMNAVIGMTHLALQTDLTPKQRDYLIKTRFAADSLLEIINDILDFSKIEAGKLEIDAKEFLLNDVLDKVTTIIGIKAYEKGLEFMMHADHAVPPVLVGDSLRLGQVLLNLCSNAVKFTEKGEIVLVVNLHDQLQDGQILLRFAVRDSGIGMTEEQAEKLFKPFSQVDTSSTRRFGGTGLGLAICKQLVELMGGEIGVESEPGKGSIFFFTARFGIDQTAVASLLPQPDLHGKRVLVVDDSETCRSILVPQLEQLGFIVAETCCGKDALQVLEHADPPFDLVLLDMMMPEMDGFEVNQRIRQVEALQQQPRIVMVTAYGNEDAEKRAKSDGLNGYLTKPFTPSSLLNVLMAAFGKAEVSCETGQKTFVPPDVTELQERLGGASILLVEDNDFNQQVATELLQVAGINVRVADNGRKAVDMVHAEPFDAVLMDVQMPVMDGHEATRLIRAEDQFQLLPIIGLTAHAMVQDQEKALQAGMNDYVSKPIDPDLLYSVLLKWVKPAGRSKKAVPPLPPKQEEADLPHSLPGISLKKGLKFTRSKSFYRSLLIDFARHKSGAVDEINRLITSGDIDAARLAVHSLKSNAGTIGASTLQEAVAELERSLDETGEASEETVAVFKDRLDEVIVGLKSVFAVELEHVEELVVGDRKISRATVSALLEQLIQLLETDIGKAKPTLHELNNLLAHTPLAKMQMELVQLMESYEVDEALKQTQRMLREIEGDGDV